MPISFLKREGKGLDLERRSKEVKLGELEGEETINRIYHMKKIYFRQNKK